GGVGIDQGGERGSHGEYQASNGAGDTAILQTAGVLVSGGWRGYRDGMQFLDLTLPTPAENLALDEALLLHAEAAGGGEVLRLWEWPSPAVVLGAGCQLAEDVDEAACLADGVPILRRASGGGTVLLGRGCLVYSLVLAYERSPALREIPSSNA